MNQTLIKALAALSAVAVLALAGFTLFASSVQSLGGVNAYQAGIWQFGNGIVAGLNGQLTVDSSGNVAFANAAGTSTLSGLGCMQMFATSSATAVKLVLSTAGATSTFKGTAYWTYGTCP